MGAVIYLMLTDVMVLLSTIHNLRTRDQGPQEERPNCRSKDHEPDEECSYSGVPRDAREARNAYPGPRRRAMPTNKAGSEAGDRNGIGMGGAHTGARRRSAALAGAGIGDRRDIRMVGAQAGARKRSVTLAKAGAEGRNDPVVTRRAVRAVPAPPPPRTWTKSSEERDTSSGALGVGGNARPRGGGSRVVEPRGCRWWKQHGRKP